MRNTETTEQPGFEFLRTHSTRKKPFFNWSKPFVQLETTRGCFNTCAFVSAAVRNPYVPSPSTASAGDFKSSTNMASKTYAYSTVHSIIMHAGQKNCSNCFRISRHTFSLRDTSGSSFRRIKRRIEAVTSRATSP